MEIEDEEEEVKTEAKPIVKKEPGVSHKTADLPTGEEDCYWCGRVIDIKQMRQVRMCDSIVYICKEC